MEYILAFILLLIGFIFGKLLLKQSNKNYDLNLLIVAVFFFVLGSKTEVFRSNDFDYSIMLSNIVPPFILGALIRRYINKHLYKKCSY
ncbi:hypothetical protein [Clostridium tagluense]|uniref:hypothetical protein n=1 Tax=Clostridium tagluense TaxID=360422 RepID=UPI001CF4D99D|nr:hypothetical protein [Clostridium tagluense]MCB2300951.1 hypothetical protein [Clostridium tagluense]